MRQKQFHSTPYEPRNVKWNYFEKVIKNEIKPIIQELYGSRNKLQQLFPNSWKFTLDGKLIGDIGEAIACHHFNLEPLKAGSKTHDAKTKDTPIKHVQIKATQRDIVGLGIDKRDFEYLIVIKIEQNGDYSLIYNGPGEIVWQSINSKSISIKKLKELQKGIPENKQLSVKNNFT